MAEVPDINPLKPIWPTRREDHRPPQQDKGKKQDSSKPKPDEESSSTDNSERKPDGHIDEYV